MRMNLIILIELIVTTATGKDNNHDLMANCQDIQSLAHACMYICMIDLYSFQHAKANVSDSTVRYSRGVPNKMGFPNTVPRSPVFEGTASHCVCSHIDSCANCIQKRKLFYYVQAKCGALFGTPLPHLVLSM